MAAQNSRPFTLMLDNCRVATMASDAMAPGAPYAQILSAAIGVVGDRIAYVGPRAGIPDERVVESTEHHDLGNRWVTPGLVDCHTHVVFGGNRSGEWELKLKGATYEEVALAGGGIVNTVAGTRAAGVEGLVEGALGRVEAMRANGATCVEIKSGYGLSFEGERDQLLAARALGELVGVDVTTTFLGAHACPREYKGREDAYVDEVVAMIAPLNDLGLADAVDAFCEKPGVGFSRAQVARVFDEARRLGIPTKVHGDQLQGAMDCGSLAAEYGCLECSHCEYASDASVAAMAAAGTVACLLPAANYFIKETRKPPVEKYRDAGVAMAVATNCNPGSAPCCSLLLAMNMGCTLFGLTPEEALLGTTRHAARAIGQLGDRGTVEVGKLADLAVWDVESPCELSYYLGLNPLSTVYRHGKLGRGELPP